MPGYQRRRQRRCVGERRKAEREKSEEEGKTERERMKETYMREGARERRGARERERESEKEEATQQQRHCRSGARKGPAENGTGRLAAALFTLPQIATPRPHLHMLPEMVTLFTLTQLGVPYLQRL